MEISLERNETTFFFFLGADCFILKKNPHTYYITFHKTYSNNGDISWQLRVLSDGLSPTSLADVPRATSPVLGPPESSQSRALVAHAGLAIRQPPCYITWDIAANRHHYVGHRDESAPRDRHHYEQSKLCHMQLSQNDWLNLIRSCVSIQQNCQEARQELCRNFCAVDRLSCGKLSNRNHKCGPQRDTILLTHRQVFPFDIIIMYMRTKYTRLLSIISQYSFPWCKNYGPRTVPISFWLQPGWFYVWHPNVSAFSHVGPDDIIT